MFPWSVLLGDRKPSASEPFARRSSDWDNNGQSDVSEKSAASQEAELLQSAIPQFLQGLQAIPEDEKKEYMHAIRVAPELVETESDPVAFLRFCNWDGAGAARRLCIYWCKRVELFGETRAFLPLLGDFSGNGALGRDEIEILKCGGFCALPSDKQGRPVGHGDRSIIPPHLQQDLDARLRACFFVLQQIMQNPVAQTAGSVYIIRGLQRQSAKDNNILRPVMSLFREALPIRVHAFHVAYLQQDKRNFFQRSVIPFLMESFGRFFYNKIVFHDCESSDELLRRMAKHDIPPASLPRYLGGLANTDGTMTASISAVVAAASLPAKPNTGGPFESEGVEYHQVLRRQSTDLLSLLSMQKAVPPNTVLANNASPASSCVKAASDTEFHLSPDGGGDDDVDTSLGGTCCSSSQMSCIDSLVLEPTPIREQPLVVVNPNAISNVVRSDLITAARVPPPMTATATITTKAPLATTGITDECVLEATSFGGRTSYSSFQMSCTDPLALEPTPNHHQPLMAPPVLMTVKPTATITTPIATTERTDEFAMVAIDYRDFHPCFCDVNNADLMGPQENHGTLCSSFEDERSYNPLDWMPIQLLDCSNDSLSGSPRRETDHVSELVDMGFLGVFDGSAIDPGSHISSQEQRQQASLAAHAATATDNDGDPFDTEGFDFNGLGAHLPVN